MKLDVEPLKYLTSQDFRVLTAVEMGQKNHELVPVPLIEAISNIKQCRGCISTLHKYKLLHHERQKYDGYRLTSQGYDYLALRALIQRGIISQVGTQIGVGKESDVFYAESPTGRPLALKLHRLGRTSFRAIKHKRDYIQHRTSYSWLYLSRLAASREYKYQSVLHRSGIPVPEPIGYSRHAVVMAWVGGGVLNGVREVGAKGGGVEQVYLEVIKGLVNMVQKGLVHCDYNEYNIMVNEEGGGGGWAGAEVPRQGGGGSEGGESSQVGGGGGGEQGYITIIDFPQMVSTSHVNAKQLYYRDLNSIIRFFKYKLGFNPADSSLIMQSEYGVAPKFEDWAPDIDLILGAGAPPDELPQTQAQPRQPRGGDDVQSDTDAELSIYNDVALYDDVGIYDDVFYELVQQEVAGGGARGGSNGHVQQSGAASSDQCNTQSSTGHGGGVEMSNGSATVACARADAAPNDVATQLVTCHITQQQSTGRVRVTVQARDQRESPPVPTTISRLNPPRGYQSYVRGGQSSFVEAAQKLRDEWNVGSRREEAGGDGSTCSSDMYGDAEHVEIVDDVYDKRAQYMSTQSAMSAFGTKGVERLTTRTKNMALEGGGGGSPVEDDVASVSSKVHGLDHVQRRILLERKRAQGKKKREAAMKMGKKKGSEKRKAAQNM